MKLQNKNYKTFTGKKVKTTKHKKFKNYKIQKLQNWLISKTTKREANGFVGPPNYKSFPLMGGRKHQRHVFVEIPRLVFGCFGVVFVVVRGPVASIVATVITC